MEEKKLNESGAELNDEQLNEAAGGFFAPRKPSFDPTAELTPVNLEKKPGGGTGIVMPPVR